MATSTLSIRVEARAKKRLAKLAKATGRSNSYLAAQALDAFLDVNEWQLSGIEKAIGSMDRGESVGHEEIKAWIESWGARRERRKPKSSRP